MDNSKPNMSSYRWNLPRVVDPRGHELKILNSFTKNKELFLPLNNKVIKWYTCGPTVYDSSHLGHARCYISFDIIRRILVNYFGYHIFYVMNITDIDDKIINRANELAEGEDIQKYKDLAIKFEKEFHDDMQKLNVMAPNAITRVTDYIDEIGLYIKRIEDLGYAYRASDGSVYFDTTKFDENPKHSYAKLVREAYGHNKPPDEELAANIANLDLKKSLSDFALWKKSKPGEPSWTTQDYAPGRPGWHIECSVMASDLLGEEFDIHSGGVDLKFPHHDNEIAQAEAYYDTGNNWVNYFVHSGHLTISDCKMSKSLKNFTTIKKALEEYTSRQLRFAFLAHSWAETLNYSPETMGTALSYEKAFKEFFLNVLDTLRHSSKHKSNIGDCYRKWGKEDKKLNNEFIETTVKVDRALCDNFDTRTAMNSLTSLIKECNKRPEADPILLKDIACYIAKMLDIFGANFDEFKIQGVLSGQPQQQQQHADKATDGDNQETILKYLEVLAQFRADVRNAATRKDQEPLQRTREILSLCDKIRDDILPKIGVRLEDKKVDGHPFVLKLV